MDAFTGGCQCGFVRYRIEGQTGPLSICHCRSCQRQSASAFGMSLAVAPNDFILSAGALKSFDMLCDSGRIKACAFCPECGTRINHRVGDTMSLKAGTLDEARSLRPDAHSWTAAKQNWVVIPKGVKQVAEDG